MTVLILGVDFLFSSDSILVTLMSCPICCTIKSGAKRSAQARILQVGISLQGKRISFPSVLEPHNNFES